MLNDVYKSVDNRQSTALTCLDLSKAFDCLQHNILLNKLRKLQLSPSFLNILTSYFVNRKQTVLLNDTHSTFENVQLGTAQGGVLSGMFFNIYINSICSLSLHSSIYLYCDDISLVTAAISPAILKEHIEEDLSKIFQWLVFHFLVANESKTKFLLFHNKKRQEYFYEQALTIRFNGTELERVENLRLLGIILDESLQFSEHIYSIQNKIIPFTFALKRIRNLISQKTALLMYHAYVQSRLMYMNVIWATAPKYMIDSLEITQRKALRITLNKPWHASRKELYSTNTLPVSLLA